MTPEELKNLTEKVKSGEATQDEELTLLKELNIAVSTIREAVKQAHSDALRESIISNVTK